MFHVIPITVSKTALPQGYSKAAPLPISCPRAGSILKETVNVVTPHVVIQNKCLAVTCYVEIKHIIVLLFVSKLPEEDMVHRVYVKCSALTLC